jgi:hypothetical protein
VSNYNIQGEREKKEKKHVSNKSDHHHWHTSLQQEEDVVPLSTIRQKGICERWEEMHSPPKRRACLRHARECAIHIAQRVLTPSILASPFCLFLYIWSDIEFPLSWLENNNKKNYCGRTNQLTQVLNFFAFKGILVISL